MCLWWGLVREEDGENCALEVGACGRDRKDKLCPGLEFLKGLIPLLLGSADRGCSSMQVVPEAP